MRRFALSPNDLNGSPAGAEAGAVLEGLNPAQQEAVRATDGPVLIIAGPGSGKTRTLTHRIAYLMALGKARPYEILALTFTNRAAREMQSRIRKLVGEDAARGLWMGTFHSIFSRILRREGEALGYTRDFTIYDREDSERLVRRLMNQFGHDTTRYSPRVLQSLISSAKNQMVLPEEYARIATGPFQERAAQLYGPYQEQLLRSNAMDFDDLLMKPVALFEQHPETLARYQQRWGYVHIDEYQDTNRVQYLLSKMLAAQHKNLCVVGDDAQSIYAFRGADIRNILDFQRDYPDATTVRLEQNYRSTKQILKLADNIIRRNEDQLPKELWTDNPDGADVLLMEAISEKDEAQKIERAIRDLQVRAGHAYREFALLYRTNAQSRSLEDALRRAGVPYRVVGGVSFYQRREIKDALAYMRLVINPSDDENLVRIINYPARGIGKKTVADVEIYARQEGLSMWQTLERVDQVDVGKRARTALERFHVIMARYVAQAATAPADEIARVLVQESGILKHLREENTIESLARWENVQELLNAVAEYTASTGEGATLSGFLQEVSLVTDLDAMKGDENRVTLMTLHSAKGLEYPVVFVTGLEEGLFPLAASVQDRKELEEERRLFYVGVTRAEQRLFLSYARSRFRFGRHHDSTQSRFLDEIDVDVVRTEAGQTFRGNARRFKLRAGGKGAYDGVAPDYWRSDGKKATRPAETSRRVVYDEGEGGGIVPGVRVEHPTFGPGKVLAVEGRGERARATVFFKSVGQKKLVLKFARLQRID